MEAFGSTVKGVRDEATWREAKPRIEAILAEITTVSEQLRSMPKPTEAEIRTFYPKTEARELALEETLGDKNTFLARLPREVSAELGSLAGQFFNKMGAAQILLRGPNRPVGSERRPPAR